MILLLSPQMSDRKIESQVGSVDGNFLKNSDMIAY